jgi:hypothetical protein
MLFDLEESGERVERMLSAGDKIMRDAIELYKPCAIFACYSSGNDSGVSAHFAATRHGAQLAMVITKTGIPESLQHAYSYCQKFDFSLVTKEAVAVGPPKRKKDGSLFDPKIHCPTGMWTDGDSAYEEFCFNFGIPRRNKSMHRRMYVILKERGFDALKREAKRGYPRNATVMFVSGVRQDESSIRAGYKTAVHKHKSSVWVNPFYYSTAADFECYRQEFGIPRNPVSQVVGISGECLCGTMATDGEIQLVEKANPSHAAYLSGIQDRCRSLGLPCEWGAATPKKQKPTCLDNQLNLIFGDEPTFMPACVGCARRNAS